MDEPWWKRLPRVRIRRPSGHRKDETLSRFNRLAWALAAGLPWGGAAILSPGYSAGTALLIAVFGGVAVYVLSGLLLATGGILTAEIFFPSGSVRPPGAGYSRAEAMAARGLHDEAAHIYAEAADADPADPEPRVRLARLHRDGTGDHEAAARWFRRARRCEGTDEGRDRQISRELIELYRRQMDQPRRAMPELARFAERFPEDPWADRARRELRRLKEEMHEDR